MIKIADKSPIQNANTNGQDVRSKALAAKQHEAKLYDELAESYETQFLQHMLEEMRKTVPKEEDESSAMNFYNSTLDQERAQIMSKRGMGIKDMILDQIYPEHRRLATTAKNESSSSIRMAHADDGIKKYSQVHQGDSK